MQIEQQEYAVVRFTDGWRVLIQGRGWKRFEYQVDAVEAALRLGRKALAEGRRVRVLVQGITGELTPEPLPAR